jgi:hypothetical protein
MDLIKEVQDGKQPGFRKSAGGDVTALIDARNLWNEDMTVIAKRKCDRNFTTFEGFFSTYAIPVGTGHLQQEVNVDLVRSFLSGQDVI